MPLGPQGLNAANFASGAMPTPEQINAAKLPPPQKTTNATAQGNLAQARTGRGAATSFANDKYTVGSMQYPSDLMSYNGQYGGNYVIFYINVQTDSKLLNELKYETVSDASAIPPRLRGDAIALNSGAGAALLVNTGAGAAFGGLAKAIGINQSSAVKGGALGLAAGGAAAIQAASFSRAQKRLKQVIALHMPESLDVKYGMDWSEDDTALAAAAYTGASTAADFMTPGKKSGIGQAALTAGTTAALKTPGLGDYTSVQTGLAANPKKEQIFKGVKYRDFSLNYKFYPRSAEEANNVREIIKTFKLHMHPEFKDAFNFLYIYPSEFDIFYYNNGVENLNLHRHTSVVLTDLSVTYAPNGLYSAFDDGMPTQINIEMSFRELALLTKDNILDGF